MIKNNINNINTFIFILFTAMYIYQYYYILVVLFKNKNEKIKSKNIMNKFAVIVSARNESDVIEEFIHTVDLQDYPSDLIDVYVIADNCSDDTAEKVRKAGAYVYERFDNKKVGKGYALDFLFKTLRNKKIKYDGYFIFDADNLLSRNYISEMNKVFNCEYKIVTSYRNSKNYDSNWISAGYSLWFLRESKYLNYARMLLNNSCAVSGTGFLISSEIIDKNNGWKYHLLTEDIEFTIDSIIKGEKIGYCNSACFYDEQPTSFRDSWNQRMRWSKGFYQVFFKYGYNLFKSIFKNKDFSCYDMFMTISPTMLISISMILFNISIFLYSLIGNDFQTSKLAIRYVFSYFSNTYLMMYMLGILTTITEWNNIQCKGYKKIFYTFTFPIFMFTYMPISICSIFKKVEWKQIKHSIKKSLEDIELIA
ncbi:glycosyltransferase [Clostridioides difficile]|uniref:glycosyltransferase family 2 protein n=1 Tax=Clostridioides difficile TaxID=1496 RepID=UPI000D1F69D9|nr:glycosyltransferase family 2 protein [Clostridioides difficile]MCA0540238.1 glycosyltransferase [Clostridioides difficile]MDL5068774.1 glycosyltransferase family 2 protein [Clostridioides difficile]MDS6334023.1 glycosyltransferase family 2 protein [Clostridioides difficile]HBF7900819.1 glycosyltransferase family 2 protein [Clostridioides difficile]